MCTNGFKPSSNFELQQIARSKEDENRKIGYLFKLIKKSDLRVAFLMG